ncbi:MULTISPECIES: hypothetical protein [unclassified Halorhabdus]|uniref:DUF7344 domain-containing protein n=1 Tax=unclassified Halorhabdus TaxID=2621901 RepID=UPI0023DB277C|nr:MULTISPECIES: hypothetical protein [unclassified Halorhabdus]WEL17527.1 Putative trancriptional regulator, ArsR family [Halorhabdus sp. SVX81]WEL21407.1 Putative trancriptional regulator, ArsR family [Halorhabdus sp. BNX81]
MSKPGDRQTAGPSIGPTNEDAAEFTRDEAFEVLSNRRRRYTLHYLKQNGEDATLSDVAEQVAAWEHGTTNEVTSSERKSVYTSLQQFHLPKLDEKGVVEFDRRTGDISLTDAAQRLDIYLELVDRYELPWSAYYLSVSVLGSVVIALSWLGIGPFATVPSVAWTAFLIVVFLVSSSAHFHLSRRMRLGVNSAPPEVANE